MRRWRPVRLFIVFLLAVSCAQGPEGGLGRRIAGVWLGTYEIDTPGSTTTAFITTYHPDGTAETTSARMFGAGDAEHSGMSSTHHVQWEVAGEREIRWRLLHFGHDAAGNLTYISRTHGLMEFNESFDSARGSFHVEVFSPAALLKPLGPDNDQDAPIFTADGTSVIARLHVRLP